MTDRTEIAALLDERAAQEKRGNKARLAEIDRVLAEAGYEDAPVEAAVVDAPEKAVNDGPRKRGSARPK
jgi:hypothetical protein